MDLEVILKIEEAEALRLKDLLGLEQVECAELMGISRTFQRILLDAHRRLLMPLFMEGIDGTGGNYHYDQNFGGK